MGCPANLAEVPLVLGPRVDLFRGFRLDSSAEAEGSIDSEGQVTSHAGEVHGHAEYCRMKQSWLQSIYKGISYLEAQGQHKGFQEWFRRGQQDAAFTLRSA